MDKKQISLTLDMLDKLESQLKEKAPTSKVKDQLRIVIAGKTSLKELVGYIGVMELEVEDISPLETDEAVGWMVSFTNGSFKNFLCKKKKKK